MNEKIENSDFTEEADKVEKAVDTAADTAEGFSQEPMENEACELLPSDTEKAIDEAEPEGLGKFIFDDEDNPTFELISDEEYAEDEDIFEQLPEDEGIDEASVPEDNADTTALTDEKEARDTAEEVLPEAEKKVRTVGTRRIDTAFDFLELFIFTLVGVLIVTSFFFRHSVVSGDSMQNTLQNGDRLIISDLFYEPEYGDIVVVEDRTAGIDSPIVKRVIATEGQLVRISALGISVDGIPLDEDYVFTDGIKYYYDLDPFAYRDNESLDYVPGEFFEFTVPEGEIFVLGDHRNDSRDSRYYGTVRKDAVLGRLILRFYPFEKFEIFIFKD